MEEVKRKKEADLKRKKEEEAKEEARLDKERRELDE